MISKQYQNTGRSARTIDGVRLWAALGIALLAMLLFYGAAAAAEFAAADDVYILPQGETIADDLYVAAPEVIINGTVDGDLLATGAYVEINGAVNGSVMGAAAGIRINGVVQNSVRVAAMSIELDGTVRKDFLASAGYGGPGFGGFAIPVGNRTLTPGIELSSNSSIAGDARLTGGSARMLGAIGGDLGVAVAALVLGGRTAGDADIRTDTLEVLDSTQIGGDLDYTSRTALDLPEGIAASVTYSPPQQDAVASTTVQVNPIWGLLARLWRLVIQLLGLALIAWLVWTFAPGALRRPVEVIETRPVEAGLYGLVGVALLIPVALALVFLGALIWGWFPGAVTFSAASFSVISIAWLLSPIVTGLWIGRRLGQLLPESTARGMHTDLQALLLGILVIVLTASVIGAVPCVGPVVERIIYLLSLALAVGGAVLTRLRPAGSQTVAG